MFYEFKIVPVSRTKRGWCHSGGFYREVWKRKNNRIKDRPIVGLFRKTDTWKTSVRNFATKTI